MQTAGSTVVNRLQLPRLILLSLLVLTSVVVVINSLESSVAKMPTLVVLASLLAAVIAFQFVRLENYPVRFSRINIAALAFAGVLLLSAVLQKFSYDSVQALLMWLGFLVCFLAGAHMFQTRKDVHAFLLTVLSISVIACVVAAVQFALAGEMRLDFFIGAEKRVIGTFGNATFFSSFIVLVIPLMLSLAVHTGTARWLRLASGSSVAVLLVMLLMTSTRTSIIALFISLLVFLYGVGGRSRKFFFGSLIAVAILAAISVTVFPKLSDRFIHSFDSNSTLARRIVFWESGLKAFAVAPIRGHGIGNYGEAMLSYRTPDYWIANSEDITEHAHNEFIEILAETGIVGFAVYTVFVFFAVRSGIRSLKVLRERERLLVWGILCSLLGIAIDGLASVSLRTAPVGALTWFLLGLLASQWPKVERVPAFARRKTRGVEWIMPAAWVLFALWYLPEQIDVIRSSQYAINGMLSKYKFDIPGRIREYEAASRLAPHDTEQLSRLIGELVGYGRHEEALAAIDRLHSMSPLFPKSNFQKSISLFSLRRYSEAAAAAKEEIRLRNHPDAFFVLGRTCERLGDIAGERDALLGLLDADIRGDIPSHLTSTSHRLIELAHTDRDRKTLDSVYRHLIVKFPGKPILHQTLSRLDSLTTRNSQSSHQLVGG